MICTGQTFIRDSAVGLYVSRVFRPHRDLGYWGTVIELGGHPALLNSIQIVKDTDIEAAQIRSAFSVGDFVQEVTTVGSWDAETRAFPREILKGMVVAATMGAPEPTFDVHFPIGRLRSVRACLLHRLEGKVECDGTKIYRNYAAYVED